MTASLSSTRRPWLFRAFRDHPASVGETYIEHMGFAGWFALKLLLAGAAALVHAIIPALFETTASTHIRELYRRIEYRNDTDPQS